MYKRKHSNTEEQISSSKKIKTRSQDKLEKCPDVKELSDLIKLSKKKVFYSNLDMVMLKKKYHPIYKN
jgi:hypothetical protein